MRSPEPTTEPEAGPERRSRGRPRQFDREAALAQATRLFWARGYEATSIAELTSAMGIGAPSLYGAFGSKEALYAEAIRYYANHYEPLFWRGFFGADTARGAICALLHDTARTLGQNRDVASSGCMMALSSVGSEGYVELGALVRTARSRALRRLKTRIREGVTDGEIPASTDVHALARFIQLVQAGMSILSRDGARRADLRSVAEVAMTAWDVRTGVTTVRPASPTQTRSTGAA